jgi:hypothetical protein
MKLLARFDQALQASHVANILRAAGIPCEVRNTTLSSALGEIPWLECAPQVWIETDADEERARCLLAETRRPLDAPPWHCPRCGELLEPQFASCWSCGATRPNF